MRLVVKVAYRKGEEMKTLSAQSQSGGERVVATMLYMLALQAITPLPFRIVDEINQGMDAKNERAVLETLLGTAQAMREAAAAAAAEAIAGGAQSARPVGGRQLFMVSPKLMPDLVHERTMRSTIVFNGPRVGPGE